jgi:dTDP-4-dehydrorhamnose reductase/dTDP-4-dehydrorhamnose 3,5-epimerase
VALAFGKDLSARPTSIPGLTVFNLPVHGDNRGWFKENWQRSKMVELGLPDFHPVQNNISFNEKAGTTRGIHAEPWDKFVSVASGKIFGAWVDLREGASFGAVYTQELDASEAIFIPRGVANSFQTLEDNTAYVYLVNDHWSASAQAEYTFLNLADETVNIPWPIPLDRAELSEKDRAHPRLAAVVAMPPKRTLVLGSNGQLGTALRRSLDGRRNVDFAGRDQVNLESGTGLDQVEWSRYSTVINAAAYTAVDAAETAEGRASAWQVNVSATSRLAELAAEHQLTLVHVSSDYVFDGVRPSHDEDEPFSPLGVYGQTKAAGDAVVRAVPRHYIVRTSWVIGEGNNFVRTMARLAAKGVSPSVVDDQRGRLTFAATLADGIVHLLDTNAAFGTYNLTNDGDVQSWADIARRVFTHYGRSAADVSGVSSADYFAGRSGAPRPLNSALTLDKIKATGFEPASAAVLLDEYLQSENAGADA